MGDPAVADAIVVRAATSGDREAAARLVQQAFSADRSAGPASDLDPPADTVPRPAAPPPDVLAVVAEQGGRVVATATATLRGQWFGGRRTVCAAVSGVAVGVEARGHGVGRALMTRLMVLAVEAGATTSALIPSTHRFYAALGYGIAGRRPVYALSTTELRALRPVRSPGMVLRRARPGDAGAVAALARARAATGSGLLDHAGRNELGADDPSGGDSYVAEVDGAVRGWCALARRPASSRHAHYDLVVHDLIADVPEVELALWCLLVGDVPSALRAEAVVAPGSLLEHSLERQQEVVEDASWMLRLLDVDAALAARGYPPALTAELVLGVGDDALPANEGTRLLTVAGGVARVRPAPRATPDAVVSAADLASLFTAHLDPFAARAQGRLELAGDPTAAVLRSLFAGPPALLARSF